jgi:hypothetical protein
MNILADKNWRSVLSELFVELGGAWLVLVFVTPDLYSGGNPLRPLILRLGFGIFSLIIAKRLREENL